MFILRDSLHPLQSSFSATKLGREQAHWFIFILLAVIVPFTSSMTSNLLRSLQTLFGLDLNARRFYSFMASPKLPWDRLWSLLWRQIPKPTVDGRLLVVLDDSINNKTGRKIFGCGFFFTHAAKCNQSHYPWSQNMLSIGLTTPIKSGTPVAFQSKMAQAVAMLCSVDTHFIRLPRWVVTDSWFDLQ